jgi:hypothetical protein
VVVEDITELVAVVDYSTDVVAVLVVAVT